MYAHLDAAVSSSLLIQRRRYSLNLQASMIFVIRRFVVAYLPILRGRPGRG